MIQTSNYFNFDPMPNDLKGSTFPHTNVNFEVLATTNYLGLRVPMHVIVDYFFHRREQGEIKTIHFKRVELTTERITSPIARMEFRPELAEKANVTDMSYWFSNPPMQVAIVSTNGWPEKEALAQNYWKRVAHASRARDLGQTSRISTSYTTAVICFLALSSLGLFWFVARKRSSKQQQ